VKLHWSKGWLLNELRLVREGLHAKARRSLPHLVRRCVDAKEERCEKGKLGLPFLGREIFQPCPSPRRIRGMTGLPWSAIKPLQLSGVAIEDLASWSSD
jgi:hypothetical protein